MAKPNAIGCKCSVCYEWQRWTPSGMVCKNGHGGVPGKNQLLYTRSVVDDLEQAVKLALYLLSENDTVSPAQQQQAVAILTKAIS